jgi:hypothetical protein
LSHKPKCNNYVSEKKAATLIQVTLKKEAVSVKFVDITHVKASYESYMLQLTQEMVLQR